MIDLSTCRFTDLGAGAPRLQRAQVGDAKSVLVSGRGSGTPATLAALRREYAFRAALQPAWAVLPLAMLPQADGAVLVLSDPGGVPLRRVDRPLAPAPFLALAERLAAAVEAMHAAGVVHLALTPDRFLLADDGERVHLTGFGFATRQQSAPARLDTELEWDDASFHYMAPELAARMDIGADRRTDLYALGCIFYELLAGVPPFADAEPAARAHAHATRQPRPLRELAPDVPARLARVVHRLLEKAPEQRHADATQLRAELRRCDPSRIDDASSRPLAEIERVHGRENELGAIADAYDHVAREARTQAVWISGRSGMGKSTLAREAIARLQAAATPLVAIGIASESSRDVPYRVLTQALESLLQYVMGCHDTEFECWRGRVAAAVVPVARTLELLLPTLARLLPADTDKISIADDAFEPEAEQVLQGLARLAACFAASARPLLLLLDDLQWADTGSLQVLERLLGENRAPLLLIGTLRPDEPGASPALERLVRTRSATSLALPALDAPSLGEMLASTLGLEAEAVASLAELVGHKTDGNPFFARQLLRRLADDGLLEQDATTGAWRWELARIAAHPGLDDMPGLVAHKLQQLPDTARRSLHALAAIGQRADTGLVAAAADLEEQATLEALAVAGEQGCVGHDGTTWGFRHDRIREAAYASLPAVERAPLHLRIARLFCAQAPRQDAYAIAAQANLARPVVEDLDERVAFARFNLEAGRRAKSATAHHSALSFFREALDFFGEAHACDDLPTARLLCGEAEFMTGALDAAERRLAALEPAAGNGIFGADLARLRAALYTTLGRYDRALEVGLAFLREAGIDLPLRPTDGEVDREYRRLRAWLDMHGIAGMRALPTLADPLQRAITDIFADLLPPAMYTDQNLVDLMLLRLANLAIAHGHANASANGYVCMNQVFGERYGDYGASRDFGALALHLVDERGLRKYQARVYHTYGTLLVPWTAPARSAREFIERAFDIATRRGDHTFALYCGRNQATGMLFAGEFLEDVRGTVERSLVSARDAKFQLVVDALLAQATLLARLQDGDHDGDTMAEPAEDAPPTLVDLAYWVYRLQAGVLFGDLGEALVSRRRAEACQHAARSFAERAELPFYGALALLALPARDADQDAALARDVAWLDAWATACPENFEARRQLVRAERARVAGRVLEAQDAYAAAMAHARRHGFTPVEALSAELAAAFHASRGHEVEALAYLRHARAAWQRWGASAKARQLQQRHPELFDDNDPSARGRRLHELDVQAVLRISNALASDIVPARLIETVMRTALESAGAAYGALALLRDGQWHLMARAQPAEGGVAVTQEPMALSSEALPVSLVRAVARTRESRVIDDGRESTALSQDDYVRRIRPRSMLCVPLLRRSELVGVLYLENNLSARVFTAAKAELLEVIASQAAFALENARLYEALVDQSSQRLQAEERLRGALAELARASRLKAIGELVASIVHEVGQPISALDTSASAAARWLDRPTPDIAEARAMLSRISLSARRAKSIIQSLRAMARKAEPQFAPLDLSEALREAVALVSAMLEEHGVTLSTSGLDVPCPVHGDRVQLQQVAINLLMNGAEAMTGLPGPRPLSLSCRIDGDRARVSVDDRGTGIAPEVAALLLEPFFTTKSAGMGMGLAICKSIVDAHQGTLSLVAGPEAGARAVFALPRLEA